MKGPKFIIQLILILLSLHHTSAQTINEKEQKKTYIVHMDRPSMPNAFDGHHQWYGSSLKAASDAAEMLYAYDHVIHGFSTRLTEKEAKSLKRMPAVLGVTPEVTYKLQTTRTPEFLGLLNEDERLPDSLSSSDVIIGVLDTGVWPEMKGFNDKGLGPVPEKWKGKCEAGQYFNSSNCNKKLIGARFFYKGYEAQYGAIDQKEESLSPRDNAGHGTHTATTAAGSAVARASFFGNAAGVARGMAPHARVAAYKVCWFEHCPETDILAAMDQAIEDGVDILSLSIVGGTDEYYKDTVSIGAFKALMKGIFVSASAGNDGPSGGTLSNVAPWITTVGAGTLDRDFPVFIKLGNGKNLTGVSLYGGKLLPDEQIPLVYAGLCKKPLRRKHVAGKIVLCSRGGISRVEKGLIVKASGAMAMILANNEDYGEDLLADAHLLPASAVGKKAGNVIRKYIASDPNPTAKFTFSGTVVGVQPSPVVASFSSRGPNPITPQILKPDLIAPGVNILAGWTGKAGPTGLEADKRRVSFNIVSGTSMSCPHVSGLAALVKAAHPDWSPSAIKSALMTTAYDAYRNGTKLLDASTGVLSNPFDHGAGHVNPLAALDPGLVYDAKDEDYLDFVCALKYSSNKVRIVTGRSSTCLPNKKYRLEDFNYPSFSVSFRAESGDGFRSVEYTRTLTNVGEPSTYEASVSSESVLVSIRVEPKSLTFRAPNEKKSYTVIFTARSLPSGSTSFARLTWSNGKHKVTSPIAFSWK